MLQFDKLTEQEQLDLETIIQKNVEKSELEKFYLFTIDPREKAKLFIWCFRFLIGVHNIAAPGNLKDVLGEEIKNTASLYIEVSDLSFKIERTFFNSHKNMNKLKDLFLLDKRGDELIDAFAILLEKQSMLIMSRFKGVLLEGNSGKEFKKVFATSLNETTQPSDNEEEINEEELEETEKTDETQQKLAETKEPEEKEDISDEIEAEEPAELNENVE